jgi:hypothetical protein
MDLTRKQAEIVRDQLAPSLRYLSKLQDRLAKVGFPPDDELYQLAKKAHDAVHSLRVEMHYRSCKSGVGRPEKSE